MAKDPAQRFATLDELVATFAAAADGQARPDLAERARRALADLDWGQTR